MEVPELFFRFFVAFVFEGNERVVSILMLAFIYKSKCLFVCGEAFFLFRFFVVVIIIV